MKILFNLLLRLHSAECSLEKARTSDSGEGNGSFHENLVTSLRQKIPQNILSSYDAIRHSEPQWLVDQELFVMMVLVAAFKPAVLANRTEDVWRCMASVFRPGEVSDSSCQCLPGRG